MHMRKMQTQKVNYPSKKIKIGQKDWTIQVVPCNHPRLGKGNWGRCQWKEQTIYISNRLGQKSFEDTLSHELLHVFLDSIGFHDKLVDKLKTHIYEKLVDGLAHQLTPFLCPKIFKIPNHLIRNNQKMRS